MFDLDLADVKSLGLHGVEQVEEFVQNPAIEAKVLELTSLRMLGLRKISRIRREKIPNAKGSDDKLQGLLLPDTVPSLFGQLSFPFGIEPSGFEVGRFKP